MASSEGATKLFAGRIESTIRTLAAQRGATVLEDVLLDLGERTEYYAFVLIDRHGLLGIDVQVWAGARIEGSSGAKMWSAQLQGERPSKLENPLTASSSRIGSLTDVLAACGRRLGPTYIADLAVFAGADLSKLNLTPAERLQIIDADDLAANLSARYDFATNPGALELGEVGDLASLLTTLNRFEDAEVQARHVGLVNSTSGGLGRWFERQQRGVQVNVSNDAVGMAPVAMRLSEDRYPGVARAQQQAPKRKTSPIALIALLVVVAVTVWMLFFGGLAVAQDALLSVLPSGQGPQQSAAPSTAGGELNDASLATAKETLKDTAPDEYSRATNLDAPLVNQAEEFTLYTWTYVDKAGQEKTITLTFDESGMLRGANRQ